MRLAYCTNVHPGEDLDAIERNLDVYAAPVRERLGWDRLGVGLWLAAPVAERLAQDGAAAARLRLLLERRKLYVFTLNAFPYGGFHLDRVKRDVYRPGWHDEARLAYTMNAARALIRLLPPDVEEGTISTLPLGWRSDRGVDRAPAGLARAVRGLADLCAFVGGARVRLLLEPEPGCAIESVGAAIGAVRAAREAAGEDAARRHLGICFDCCHQAVMGEDLVASLRALRAAGVRVGKMHVSSALVGRVADLGRYAEPRYLHQVVACEGGARADDLEDIAGDPAWADRRVRVHFHVPVHARTLPGGLETTQDALAAALGEVRSWPEAERPDFEVETYTWQVLPDPPAELADGIAWEMRWARDRLEPGSR